MPLPGAATVQVPPPPGAPIARNTRYLTPLQAFLPPLAFQWVRYLVVHGGVLSWRKPATFTQRLFVKMARDRNPLLTRTADKAGLRGYVQEVLGDGHLPALYAVLDRPDELLTATLPARYVVKATHSSGQVILVRHDSLAMRQQVVREALEWLAFRHHRRHGEWAYVGVRPRIIVEEYLDGGDLPVPPDWKWFCFGGKAGLVSLEMGRYRGPARARNLYTPDGEWLDATLHYPRGHEVPIPDTFGEMRRIAERLSKPFDFVRVDLYALPGRVVVGELTHYPAAGTQVFDPPHLDHELGALWDERRLKA